MKKLWKTGLVLSCTAALAAGCGQQASPVPMDPTTAAVETEAASETISSDTVQTAGVSADVADATVIKLSDEQITVDGENVSEDSSQSVYIANDIVFYPEGKDFTFGEGTEADEHSQEEADAHTVVHITQPGTYVLSGSLSAGQIAVDLGEDAEEDPNAVVTLILSDMDIHCSVAPGVIFYNVYECGEADETTATKDVDTSAAGANVVIADGTVNSVNGSYVARIYKSVELNEDGTEVVDSKKLHKYDGAFYSKMSMNIDGGEDGTGILNITAENEGLDSELHLTLNGGQINIASGNDGINTNEDNVSVTTINGGTLNIQVDGSTGEGDGIDSNGWLVINGGTVITEACSSSMDAGIDSDKGIHINGGTVIASGNMLDHIADSAQNYAVFSLASRGESGAAYTLKNEAGDDVISCAPTNSFSNLLISSADLVEGTYTFWNGETPLAASKSGGAGGMFGGGPGGFPGDPRPEGGMRPPEGFEFPNGMEPPEGMEFPEGMNPPERFEFPDGMEPPEGFEFPGEMNPPVNDSKPVGNRPGGGRGERPGTAENETAELSSDFTIEKGDNYFNRVSYASAKN